MLTILCKGTPYEIGYTHGEGAKDHISRCIAFYSGMFLKSCKQTWTEVLQTASSFETGIREKWPKYHQEMQGIADGSGKTLLDIIALNVRTEIAFGQFSDGCTSLSWKTKNATLLGQNWDWKTSQKDNLVLLTIQSDELPTIKMVTEAGLIGKIGMNSSGVGVCLNAIRAIGCDSSRLPVHLGLRMALECTSAEQAIRSLESYGMASSAHILIGDKNGAVGLEFTSQTFARLQMDDRGRVYHSNHLLDDHPGDLERPWLKDSGPRVARIKSLAAELDHVEGDISLDIFAQMFEDQEGFPSSICRFDDGGTDITTVFNIVMDLTMGRAIVRVGRPCEPEEVIKLGVEPS